MKKFENKKNNYNFYYILLIVIQVIIFMNYYNNKISNIVLDITYEKLLEITTLYIKKDIVPKYIDYNKLMLTMENEKNEIVSIDLNVDYANKILVEIIEKIQNNILELEKGDINNFINSKELKRKNNDLYLEFPLLIYKKGIISYLGPKIPVKIKFYEQVIGNIENKIENYGINNTKINVIMSINLKQRITMPYTIKEKNIQFDSTIGSKIVQGVIPIYYGNLIGNK